MRALLDILNDEKRLLEESKVLEHALTTFIPYEERKILRAGLEAIENQLKQTRTELREYFRELNK